MMSDLSTFSSLYYSSKKRKYKTMKYRMFSYIDNENQLFKRKVNIRQIDVRRYEWSSVIRLIIGEKCLLK